jgi:phytoene dehydrogenase-like protein
MYKQSANPTALDELDELPGTFVTITSLKDRTKQQGSIHTLESFVFVPWEMTAGWQDSALNGRPKAYLDFKERTMDKMVAVADKAIPGLRDSLVFRELGTPLSNRHYTGGTRGHIYGPKRTRDQLGPFGFDSKTPFKGLHLCGSSALSHGVSGATISGLQTAGEVLGVRCDTLLTGGGQIRTMLASDVPTRRSGTTPPSTR